MTTLTIWTTLAVARVLPTPRYLPRAHPANSNCHPHNCDVTIICLLLIAIWNRNWRFFFFSNSCLKRFQKVCKKNDLDRVLPSVDVVLLLTLHGPRYWVFHRFHMCIPLFYIDSCLLYRFASLCGCRSIFILFEVLKLYTCIYIILWICYCGVQLPVCTLAYVKQNICFKTVNLNDSSTGWILSFKLQHN